MRKLLFILITLILFIVNPFNGFAKASFERCENITPQPKIKLSGSFGRLSYDNDLNYKELEAKVGRPIAGLSSLKHSSSSRVSFELKEQGNGMCVVPSEVDIYIGIITPVIYVAKELRPGECEYNLVLRHEQAHMQINIRTYNHFIKVVRKGFEEVSKNIKPVYVTSQAETKSATLLIAEEYNAVVLNFVEQLKSETDEEHQKLDGKKGQNLENTICRRKVIFH